MAPHGDAPNVVTDDNDPDVKTIFISKGNWIKIRKEATLGDVEHVITQRLKRGTQANLTIDTIYELEVRTVAWSMPDPVTPDSVRKLSIADARIIAEALNDEQKEVGEDGEEIPNNSSSSSDGSEKSQDLPNQSDG